MVSGLHLTCDIMSSTEWFQSGLGEAEVAEELGMAPSQCPDLLGLGNSQRLLLK